MAQISLDDIDLVGLVNRLAQQGAHLPHPIAGLPQVYCGTATPTLSAAPGSLYLKQNGASSGLFVNTSAANPGTTWTAVTIP